LPALGVGKSYWTRLVSRPGLREFFNGIENLASVADGHDSNLLQIVGSETGENVQVDPVITERLLVGL